MPSLSKNGFGGNATGTLATLGENARLTRATNRLVTDMSWEIHKIWHCGTAQPQPVQ